MFGNVTAPVGLHVTGKYRTQRDAHMLQACGLGSSQEPFPVSSPPWYRERDFFVDNLLVRFHFIIVMIRWTGLAPWEFEFPFPGGEPERARAIDEPLLRHARARPSFRKSVLESHPPHKIVNLSFTITN